MSIGLDRRVVRNLDPYLATSTVLLCLFGLVMVYSTTRYGLHPLVFVRSQVLHFVVGAVIAGAILAVDYRSFASGARR